MKFDHIGLVVPTLANGRKFLSNAFRIDKWTEEFADPGIQVYVQFGVVDGEPCYELIAPLGDNSPVAGTLKASKNILNHVAYLVEDIAAEGARMRAFGCVPVADPQPAVAYGNRNVQFYISPLRFMLELIEAPGHQHHYISQLK